MFRLKYIGIGIFGCCAILLFATLSRWIYLERTERIIENAYKKQTNVILFSSRYGCYHTFILGYPVYDDYWFSYTGTDGEVATNLYGYGQYAHQYRVVDLVEFAEHTNEYPMPKGEK